jgi:hypothetical protein
MKSKEKKSKKGGTNRLLLKMQTQHNTKTVLRAFAPLFPRKLQSVPRRGLRKPMQSHANLSKQGGVKRAAISPRDSLRGGASAPRYARGRAHGRAIYACGRALLRCAVAVQMRL